MRGPRAGRSVCFLLLLLVLSLARAPIAAAAESFPEEPQDSYVAACVITKDDNRDIREWVEYHRRIGTGRFYFFDHNSTVPQINELQDYVRSGLVQYRFFARTRFLEETSYSAQHHVYNRCLAHYGARHRWMMFLDTDEFVVVAGGRPLPALLAAYEPYGGLGLNWLIYGSAGHEARPPGGALENYDQCNPNRTENRHMKTILQPRHAVRCLSPHHFLFRDGYRCVSTNRAAVPGDGPFVEPFRLDVAYIAHFFTKSREDWGRKIARGSGDNGHKKLVHFEHYNDGNRRCDRVLMPAAPAPSGGDAA